MKNIYLLLRYLLILIFGIFIEIFYTVFTPLTKKLLIFILNIFTQAYLVSDTIITPFLQIKLVPACIGGSAYFLLLFLILSIPNLKTIKRTNIILISFASFFFLNILRILILLLFPLNYIESFHFFFWYVVSTVFVIAIWLIIIRVYKIKQIPVYDDFNFLLKQAKKSKRRK